MTVFSVLARTLAIFLGLFSLMGALWIGRVTPGILAGFCAFSAAFIPVTRPGVADKRSRAILALSVIGLACQAADVAYYYIAQNTPGNYYGWGAGIVYFATLGAMAWVGWSTLPGKSRAANDPND